MSLSSLADSFLQDIGGAGNTPADSTKLTIFGGTAMHTS
jgi:hypothetical protein